MTVWLVWEVTRTGVRILRGIFRKETVARIAARSYEKNEIEEMLVI